MYLLNVLDVGQLADRRYARNADVLKRRTVAVINARQRPGGRHRRKC